MTKLFVMILGAAAVGLLARIMLTRMGLLKPRKDSARDNAMSRLKRELDLLLWIPPILLGLGAVYIAASLIYANFIR
jgi:hypothetical protein